MALGTPMGLPVWLRLVFSGEAMSIEAAEDTGI